MYRKQRFSIPTFKIIKIQMNTTQNNNQYKNSPLGLIPEDWEVKRFGEISKVNQGLQIQIEDRLTEEVANSYKYITIQYLNKGKDIEFILNPTPSVLCNDDDVLMTRTGNTGIVVSDVSGVFHNNFFKINFDRQVLNKVFLIEYLRSNKTQHTLLIKAGVGTIPDLNHKDFYSIFLPIPPVPEQTAIANCLSTWDKTIATQTQIIAQKELRKKALMQQLLSGKERLKGFSGEWKEVRLKDVFDEIKETNDGELSHTVMTISSKLGLISQQDKFDRVIAGDSLKKYTLIKKGSFAYNKGNSKTYQMGCVFQLEEINSALVPFVYICFKPSDKVCSTFYKHWFSQHGLDRQLQKIITSGARGDGLLNVNTNDFFKLKIIFPTKEEQTAIANILQCGDEEIQILKMKLQQLKEQKKGLMQVLLTGKKRLKY
jgi:type I restriction enzyme S subunit